MIKHSDKYNEYAAVSDELSRISSSILKNSSFSLDYVMFYNICYEIESVTPQSFSSLFLTLYMKYGTDDNFAKIVHYYLDNASLHEKHMKLRCRLTGVDYLSESNKLMLIMKLCKRLLESIVQ